MVFIKQKHCRFYSRFSIIFARLIDWDEIGQEIVHNLQFQYYQHERTIINVCVKKPWYLFQTFSWQIKLCKHVRTRFFLYLYILIHFIFCVVTDVQPSTSKAFSQKSLSPRLPLNSSSISHESPTTQDSDNGYIQQRTDSGEGNI